MEKPVSIIVAESKQKIVDTINELHLSPTIMEFIIKDIYEGVQQAHIAEYNNDMANYETHNTLEKESKDVGVKNGDSKCN